MDLRYLCTSCKDYLVAGSAPGKGEALVCPSCGSTHPVRNGIPRFVPDSVYADSFGYQWNIHRRTQLDSYTGLPISRERLFSVTGWPRDLKGESILEAGSGAGRFTEVLLDTGAEVYSLEYSNAVEANYKNNGDKANLHLIQADIFDIPLPAESFDKVICIGVLQHTPDPWKAFRSLVPFLKKGGALVVDSYRAGVVARLQWKYALRPLTKRMESERLYRLIKSTVPPLIPVTRTLSRSFGRLGARLSPIVEYSDLGLSPELNRDWAVLDTFDMYSPAYDRPQSVKTLKRWFSECGLVDVVVRRGPNGVVGIGRKAGK